MKKLKPWNKRMLQLMNEVVGTPKVQTEQEFFISIGFPWRNSSQVKKGVHGFQIEHFIAAGKKYNVSMDWFFGFTDQIKRKPAADPLELLNEAVFAVNSRFGK